MALDDRACGQLAVRDAADGRGPVVAGVEAASLAPPRQDRACSLAPPAGAAPLGWQQAWLRAREAAPKVAMQLTPCAADAAFRSRLRCLQRPTALPLGMGTANRVRQGDRRRDPLSPWRVRALEPGGAARVRRRVAVFAGIGLGDVLQAQGNRPGRAGASAAAAVAAVGGRAAGVRMAGLAAGAASLKRGRHAGCRRNPVNRPARLPCSAALLSYLDKSAPRRRRPRLPASHTGNSASPSPGR